WLSRSDEVKTDFYSELDEGGSTGNDPAWNRWAEAIAHRIAAKLDIELNNDLIDQLEQYDAALQQRFDRRKEYFEKQDASVQTNLQTQIDDLVNDVADLRAEIADLRDIIGADDKERSAVIPMLTFKGGGRDAA